LREKAKKDKQEQMMLQDEFSIWYIKQVSEWLSKAITEEAKGTPFKESINILANLHRYDVHPKFKRLKLTKEFTKKALTDAMEVFGFE